MADYEKKLRFRAPKHRPVTKSTARLENALRSDDEDELERTLDTLGTIEIGEGKLRWTPPEDLDDVYKKELQESVRALNKLIRSGAISISQGRLVPKWRK